MNFEARGSHLRNRHPVYLADESRYQNLRTSAELNATIHNTMHSYSKLFIEYHALLKKSIYNTMTRALLEIYL